MFILVDISLSSSKIENYEDAPTTPTETASVPRPDLEHPSCPRPVREFSVYFEDKVDRDE